VLDGVFELLDVELPNSEARPPPPLVLELPESVTELAVTVPLLVVMPSTTTESPGWIAPAPTLSDFVTFDSGVVTTATVLPLVSVTSGTAAEQAAEARRAAAARPGGTARTEA
jgi:hypothetical protein